jgi:fimbrial chaperone protein
MRRGEFLALLGASIALPGTAGAQTAGVQVTPVIVGIAPTRTMTSMRLRNWRDQEVSFEIAVLSWTQQDGRDVLSETSDLIATPRLFAIAPGAEQIVRLALARDARGANVEQAFRLLIRELPRPGEGGLNVQLQMSLPVFAPPARMETVFRAERTQGDIVLANAGNSYAQLARVTIDGERPLANVPRYLLAGAWFTAPLPRGARALNITYATGDRDLATETLNLEGQLASVGPR